MYIRRHVTYTVLVHRKNTHNKKKEVLSPVRQRFSNSIFKYLERFKSSTTKNWAEPAAYCDSIDVLRS